MYWVELEFSFCLGGSCGFLFHSYASCFLHLSRVAPLSDLSPCVFYIFRIWYLASLFCSRMSRLYSGGEREIKNKTPSAGIEVKSLQMLKCGQVWYSILKEKFSNTNANPISGKFLCQNFVCDTVR